MNMSPTCMIKPKQSIYQQKLKSTNIKTKSKQKIEVSVSATDIKHTTDEYIYIELDTKCSCPHTKANNNSSIQFSRRYLQCQSSMPIAILRSYIQTILPHSSMTQVSLYDSNDRLLDENHLLHSLKHTSPSSSLIHIPIRFTLFNTITSLGHCLCSSLLPSSEQKPSLSSYPTVIRSETIDQTLSTCSVIPPSSSSSSSSIYSPCLSSTSSSSPPLVSSNTISIVNLLTPPSSISTSSSSCHNSFMIENLVESNQSMIDEITSQFGEICAPLRTTKKSRNRSSKKVMSSYSPNVPLDLSLKKRPLPSSSYDVFSSPTKWLKT